MTHQAANLPPPPGNARWLGHPAGAGVLVGLKTWELFSYQGMRAFLVFYLIGSFALSDSEAALIFGSYSALVLALSVLGGVVADRWLGPREPMTIGALMIMSGHICLAGENVLVELRLLDPAMAFQVFCLGLGLIAVGTGLLKPNVLNLLGALYRRDDPQRERGYYFYYIGVNIGSFAAPLVCGYLAERYGWGWGFAAAAIGMAAGLVVLFLGRRYLNPVEPHGTGATRGSRLLIYLGVLAAVGASSFLIQNGVALGVLLIASLVASAAYFAVQSSRESKSPLLASLLMLMAVPMSYSMLFEQFSLSINLFVDRHVSDELYGIAVSAPQLLSLNAFFVLMFLPLLSAVWAYLGRRGLEPKSSVKFAIGFGFIGSGFLVLVGSTILTPPGAQILMGFVAMAYFLITMGEICIAPLAFASVGQLIPQRLQGVAMGMLFLAFALGNLGASWLATAAAIPAGMIQAESRAIYADFFLKPAFIALFAIPLCLLAGRWLNYPDPAAKEPAA